MTDFCAPPHVVASDTVPLEVAIQARAVLANHGATDVAEALDGRAAGWMWPL